MAGIPKSVALSRELLITLHDAQIEAAAAIGLRGYAAKRAMRRAHIRIDEDRWKHAVRAARKTEIRRATADDYRSTVPVDQGDDAASGPLDNVMSGEASSGTVECDASTARVEESGEARGVGVGSESDAQ